jgi:hypothetical protein
MPGFKEFEVPAINNKPPSIQERISLLEKRIYQLELDLLLMQIGGIR